MSIIFAFLFAGDARRSRRGLGDGRLADRARLQAGRDPARQADDRRRAGRRAHQDRALLQPALGRRVGARLATHQS